VPAGRVISQSPTGGTSVAAGSAVNLVVSSGPPPATVPNVVGQTQSAATTAITGAGLVVGTVTQQPSSTVPAGRVISQSPTGGTSVAAGSAVNLVVSSGPNRAPTVTNPGNQQSLENMTISPLQIVASDPDGDTLSYAASSLPVGLSINPGTGVISGRPTKPGKTDVTVVVTDSHGATGQVTFRWAINKR
jgi:beta-lactam-binding protein with PASTA domain